MSTYVERFVEHIQEAEHELALEAAAQQRRWRYRMHRGRVWFDQEARDAHRRLKQGIPQFLWHSSFLSLVTAPVIYSLLVPLLVLDAWVTLYQWTCLPIYGVARVRRRKYVVFDRHKLSYLNGIEKMNCTFCSYANGLFAYVREVAARTEPYWCPIKHGRAIHAPHARYHLFVDYVDAERYRRDLAPLRRTLRREPARGDRNHAAAARRRR